MAPFSRTGYEQYLYALPETNHEIASSSLRLFTVGRNVGMLKVAATYPHHRHEPPDIKHNRRPAQGISFQAPNLPALIDDCIKLGATVPNGAGS